MPVTSENQRLKMNIKAVPIIVFEAAFIKQYEMVSSIIKNRILEFNTDGTDMIRSNCEGDTIIS